MAQWQSICLPVQEMQETWVQSLGGKDPLEEEMVKAVKDLCEASRHIQPEYQERAMAACWIELARQIAIDAQGGKL